MLAGPARAWTSKSTTFATLTPWQPSPPVSLVCTNMWCIGLSCWTPLSSCPVFKSFLSPPDAYTKTHWRTDHSYSSVCQAGKREQPDLFTHHHYPHAAVHTQKCEGVHADKRLVCCSNDCYNEDWKERHPRPRWGRLDVLKTTEPKDVPEDVCLFYVSWLTQNQFHYIDSFIKCNFCSPSVWLYEYRLFALVAFLSVTAVLKKWIKVICI